MSYLVAEKRQHYRYELDKAQDHKIQGLKQLKLKTSSSDKSAHISLLLEICSVFGNETVVLNFPSVYSL